MAKCKALTGSVPDLSSESPHIKISSLISFIHSFIHTKNVQNKLLDACVWSVTESIRCRRRSRGRRRL